MTSMSLLSLDHPGPASVTLPADLVQAIVDHTRSEYPNEACGVIVGDRPAADGGVALRWVPMRNEYASPLRYRIHAQDLYPVLVEVDDADDRAFWAIVHSHVRSAAYPSPTDVGQALFPDALYLLVSLEADEPAFGAFRIVDGTIFPVELLVGATA
jgi:[CysO sulfur-carrier protein]-S-L-cysteine hydrolase